MIIAFFVYQDIHRCGMAQHDLLSCNAKLARSSDWMNVHCAVNVLLLFQIIRLTSTRFGCNYLD